MIFWVTDRDKLGCGCVIPRVIYGPKGVIPCIFSMTEVDTLMIIWVKGREQLVRDCVILRGGFVPRRRISCNFLHD